VAPAKARRGPALVARLKALEGGAPEAVVEAELRHLGPGGARTADLRARTPLGPDALRGVLQALTARGRALVVDREWYVHVEAAERLGDAAVAALAEFHAREPLKPGMSKEELRTRLAAIDERVFLHLLERVAAAGLIAVEKDKVRLRTHAVRLDDRQRALVDRLEAEFRQAGVTPPSLEEAFGKLGIERAEDQALAQVLVDERRLVRVREGLYFHAEPLQAAESRVVGLLRERGSVTPQDVKDLLGMSRKYAIPFMEYLDAQRLTVRQGDRRILRELPR
jgi:selenocysteine-specific elongation factor